MEGESASVCNETQKSIFLHIWPLTSEAANYNTLMMWFRFSHFSLNWSVRRFWHILLVWFNRTDHHRLVFWFRLQNFLSHLVRRCNIWHFHQMALFSLSEGRKMNPSIECTLISGCNLKHKVCRLKCVWTQIKKRFKAPVVVRKACVCVFTPCRRLHIYSTFTSRWDSLCSCDLSPSLKHFIALPGLLTFNIFLHSVHIRISTLEQKSATVSSLRVRKKSHNARLCLCLWHDRWVNYSHVKLHCQLWRKMVMIHKFPQPQFTAHYRVFIVYKMVFSHRNRGNDGRIHIYIFIVTLSLNLAGRSLISLKLTIITFFHQRARLMSPSGFFSLPVAGLNLSAIKKLQESPTCSTGEIRSDSSSSESLKHKFSTAGVTGTNQMIQHLCCLKHQRVWVSSPR